MVLCIKINNTKYQSIPGKILSSLFSSLISFLISNKIPGETILFTIELHYIGIGNCEVVFVVSDTPEHIGRSELYVNCIFFGYSKDIGKIIKLHNVKKNPHYLELDSRVNSEMFYEYRINDDMHIILNCEFSTCSISCKTQKWFQKTIDILTELVYVL